MKPACPVCHVAGQPDVFHHNTECPRRAAPADLPGVTADQRTRTPSDQLRKLYTALIADVHTLQRRLGHTQGAAIADVHSRMERCIGQLEPLIDSTRVVIVPDDYDLVTWAMVNLAESLDHSIAVREGVECDGLKANATRLRELLALIAAQR